MKEVKLPVDAPRKRFNSANKTACQTICSCRTSGNCHSEERRQEDDNREMVLDNNEVQDLVKEVKGDNGEILNLEVSIFIKSFCFNFICHGQMVRNNLSNSKCITFCIFRYFEKNILIHE